MPCFVARARGRGGAGAVSAGAGRPGGFGSRVELRPRGDHGGIVGRGGVGGNVFVAGGPACGDGFCRPCGAEVKRGAGACS